jgi:hypothetical protein
MWMDPVMQSLDAYYSQMTRKQNFQDRVEYEMTRLVKDARNSARVMVHPELVEEFLRLLAFGYYEDLPEALSIVKQLNLGKKHMHAISEEQDSLAAEMRQDDEDAYLDRLEAMQDD